MKILSFLLAVLLCGCTHLSQPSMMNRPDAQTEAAFMELRTDLQDAIAGRNRQQLEKLLAPSFVFVHSTGKLESQAEFIERTVGTSNTQGAPTVEFIDNDIRIYGNTAVWVTHSRRGRTAVTFVGTDVLVYSAGRWQWVSVQSTRTDH